MRVSDNASEDSEKKVFGQKKAKKLTTMGKICHACFELQQNIEGIDLRNGNKGVVLFVFQAQWNMLRRDLHIAGYVLDPRVSRSALNKI